eukprot:CAMPEP_0196723248 /NCGR_PEP_ID=MMETSP1091-20130531/5390_1 /TAXON_ID=302021 /ORGANISM="Rhodomonas sp., Strain CCMP768" /LENGTH=164 /DNA_ID=CAMNT_0042065105 /DNA_START=39 /DNA_END=533 /DNA_ORIENTATION=-
MTIARFTLVIVLLFSCLSLSNAFMSPTIALLRPSASSSSKCRTSSLALRAGSDSLLDRLGGPCSLDACVEEFYDRLMEDEELGECFAGVSELDLKEDQRNLMRVTFTGVPEDKKIADLKTGLKAAHFEKVATHLVNTLQFLAIDEDVVAEAKTAVTPLKGLFSN